ncbi:hypothetical protein B0F90DRAFT_1728913 [Multifurca ochricompacta]|uniref:Uncharacterized protein n=1 Tax=Multifurca ochricompacta TaxID=376703 RepID=A0AAD4QMS6_9AGAM|nr:hypothetical protein B0F90DRAFT_1728913 [Multifurca ochricompacta]
MSSPTNNDLPISSSPKSIRADVEGSPIRYRSPSTDSDPNVPVRRSPTLTRSFNPMDPDARERQRTLDVDMAMHLSRARKGSVSVSPVAVTSPLAVREHNDREPETHPHHEEGAFPTLSLQDERELEFARGGIPRATHNEDPYRRPLTPDDLRLDLDMGHHLIQGHESHLFGSLGSTTHQFDGALPLYQPPVMHGRQTFDFDTMEEFAKAEKKKLGLSSSPTDERFQHMRARKPSQVSVNGDVGSSGGNGTDFRLPAPRALRERKLSQSDGLPRRHGGGKMALFEGALGAPPASLSGGIAPPLSVVPSFAELPSATAGGGGGGGGGGGIGVGLGVGHDRPYRFSFYSNALSATIHARSLSELPADGQSFEDMFNGMGGPPASQTESRPGPGRGPQLTSPFAVRTTTTIREDVKMAQGGNGGEVYKEPVATDPEGHTWWLDILSPTDEEMKMLSKVFGIHPLTAEDIQMEEAREKIELFRTYYLVCFRSFDQDPYSPTHLEPLNMYIIVFREGILSFHFRPTPHPQNVRRRIKQLKDYISVTSDWISYALIDDITDAFGPLIQGIEYEVDSIDELVLILKDAEQSDMLRRIGRCRLAKRCNENWKVAPTSDIGLYLSDIQDHLITMTQNLNHYEKIFHAPIRIILHRSINEVLSKLTALGTILIPMNLITGNVSAFLLPSPPPLPSPPLLQRPP